MSEISALSPQKVWYFFDLICSIPHISKHETALADRLAQEAEKAGLNVIKDEIGNLIIKRPASPGFENSQTILLQAHMDMVPASDHEFDFLTTAIEPYIDGDWIRTRGTTLGADDGIGVAHAMAVVTDKDFNCGPLTVILTVDEEAGMSGARNLDAAHLQGKYMLNLDGSDRGFCIGCAGGLRQEFTFIPEYVPAPADGDALKITLSGLPGGHSGLCINDNRGNALKFIAEFFDQQPEIKIASLNGGTADNAIPYQAEAEVITTLKTADLENLLAAYTMLVRKDCPKAENMSFTLTPIARPATVWSEKFRTELLSALALAPNGAMEENEDFGIVKTSSNLAMIRTGADEILVRTSQRSLDDQCRDDVAAMLQNHFALFNATAAPGDVYPATTPKLDGELLKRAVECAKKFNKSCKPYAIHAGLETGWFSVKNPDLEVISCGPDHLDYHTPYESLNIPSVEKFDIFLRQLLCSLA